MPVEIRELRPDDLDAALALVREHGAAGQRPVIPRQSLIARDGDQLLAVLLTTTGPDGGHTIDLALNPDAPFDLGRRLLDTALLKTTRRGGTARLHLLADADTAEALLAAAHWTPEPIDPAARAA